MSLHPADVSTKAMKSGPTVPDSRSTKASNDVPEGRIHVNPNNPVIMSAGSVYDSTNSAHEDLRKKLTPIWGNSPPKDALSMAAELADTGEAHGKVTSFGDGTYIPRGEYDGTLTYSEETGLKFRGKLWSSECDRKYYRVDLESGKAHCDASD